MAARQTSSVRDDLPPWGWWLGPVTVVLAFTAVIALAIALGAALGTQGAGRLTDEYPQWTGIVQDCLWIAAAIAVPIAAYGYLRPGHLGLGATTWRRSAAIAVAGLVVFYALAAGYGAAAGLDENSNERLKDTGLGASVASDVGYVLLYVVFAPVAEELLFRGALFGSLRGRLGPWPAALISGAIFGAIHLGGGQDAFIPVLAALGVVLALTYHYSGALYAPIAIHAVNNAVSTASSQPPAADWIYVLFAAAPLIAVALAWAIGRTIAARAPTQPRPHPLFPIKG